MSADRSSLLALTLPRVLTATLVLTACGGDPIGGPDGQPLLGARLLGDDQDAIEIEFSGCDDAPGVEVNETESRVRVTVEGPNHCDAGVGRCRAKVEARELGPGLTRITTGPRVLQPIRRPVVGLSLKAQREPGLRDLIGD